MVQRVEYDVFPNTRDELLVSTLNKVLGHVYRSKLSWKAWREWLRDEDLWDKEVIPRVMSLLEIERSKGKKVTLGPWSSDMLDANGADEQADLIYQRLLDENTLLIKYVFEALDMEGGGRLHSTYELHRMLTSYVYPGEPIRLPDFQNWIKWAVLSGRVKLIGIRWGLTDIGKKAVPRLRMIDVDEFLEEEAEALEEELEEAAVQQAAEQGTVEQGAPAETATPVAASAAQPEASEAETPAAKSEVAAKARPVAKGKKKKKKAKKDSKPEPEPEDLPDMPPEAPPVDEDVFRQYEADLEEAAPAEEAPTEQPAPRARRRPTARPRLVMRDAGLEAGCSKEPLGVPEVIAALREVGRKQGLVGGSLLLAFGLETRLSENEAVRHLFLAALLARLHARQPDGSLAERLIDRVGALLPVAVLLERPEALPEVIVRWGFGQPDEGATWIRGALLDAVLGGRVLNSKPDTPTILAEAATSEVLFGMLTQGVLRGAPPLAVFWLIREMVRVGLWKHEAATSIAFLPTRANRLMAYRLRLIDSHFAASTARLIELARGLSRILPPGSVEAAAFDDLSPADHLRFDCREVEICQQPCGLSGPE